MTNLEERKQQYWSIFELLNRDPRIYIKDIALKLKIDPNTASNRLAEALAEKYFSLPQVRKCSYQNMIEYVHFIDCKNPLELFRQYQEDTNVVYHARMSGFASMWITSKEKIDFEGVVIDGPRSDYYVSHPPNHSWKQAIQIMQRKTEAFSPKVYQPKEIIRNHWNETIEWDETDEILYREFKYNLRKKFSSIMRTHHISANRIYRFLGRMQEYCTVFTRYFPETIMYYDPYLFMFETDYEDFIIELFSELPTSSFSFKVADRLFLYANIERTSIREPGRYMSDISQLDIPLLVEALLKKGILRSEEHTLVEYYWAKPL